MAEAGEADEHTVMQQQVNQKTDEVKNVSHEPLRCRQPIC